MPDLENSEKSITFAFEFLFSYSYDSTGQAYLFRCKAQGSTCAFDRACPLVQWLYLTANRFLGGIIYKISFSFPLLRAKALSGYFHSYKRSSDTTMESL